MALKQHKIILLLTHTSPTSMVTDRPNVFIYRMADGKNYA